MHIIHSHGDPLLFIHIFNSIDNIHIHIDQYIDKAISISRRSTRDPWAFYLSSTRFPFQLYGIHMFISRLRGIFSCHFARKKETNVAYSTSSNYFIIINFLCRYSTMAERWDKSVVWKSSLPESYVLVFTHFHSYCTYVCIYNIYVIMHSHDSRTCGYNLEFFPSRKLADVGKADSNGNCRCAILIVYRLQARYLKLNQIFQLTRRRFNIGGCSRSRYV